MPQNTKDSNGGKSHHVKETGVTGGKNTDKNAVKKSADKKEGSVTGAHNKGRKKTTP